MQKLCGMFEVFWKSSCQLEHAIKIAIQNWLLSKDRCSAVRLELLKNIDQRFLAPVPLWEVENSETSGVCDHVFSGHRTVWIASVARSLISFQKLTSLVTKAFVFQMRPKPWKINAKTAFFRHRWRTWKVARLPNQRLSMSWNCWCPFFSFVSFLWHFKQKISLESLSSVFHGPFFFFFFFVKIRK